MMDRMTVSSRYFGAAALGIVLLIAAGPTNSVRASGTDQTLYDWLNANSARIVKRGRRISKRPHLYEYIDQHNKVVGQGQYGRGHAVTLHAGQELAPVSYYEIRRSYIGSAWRLPENTGNQTRHLQVPTYCRKGGERRSGRGLGSIYSDGDKDSGAYIPASGVCRKSKGN